jgi:hypothetical protein
MWNLCRHVKTKKDWKEHRQISITIPTEFLNFTKKQN